MQISEELLSPAGARNSPHTLSLGQRARFPGLVALLRHCHKDPFHRQDAKARRKHPDGTLSTSRNSAADALAISVPSPCSISAGRIDTISSRTRSRPCARGTGEDSKKELSCQFGKRYRSPNTSGKIAAIFPAILVAYYTSASGFEPVRSGFRFHSGPGIHPPHPAIDAWREMKPGGA